MLFTLNCLTFIMSITLILIFMMLFLDTIDGGNTFYLFHKDEKPTVKIEFFSLSILILIVGIILTSLCATLYEHENNIYHETYLKQLDNNKEKLAFKDSIKRKINKNFDNMEYKIHIIDDDKHVHELKNTIAIIGVKELKKEGNDILAELDVIDEDNLFQNKIALLNQQSLSSITENIYTLNHSSDFIESFPHVKSTEPDTDTKILNEKQDIDTVKKLVSTK